LAEVLGAFSLASDLAMGLPAEHGLRACYISMHLAEEIELPAQEKHDLYYAGLVKDGGCTCSSSQMATFLAGDEMAAIADLVTRNQDDELAMLSWVAQHVASGASFATRAKRILDFLVHSRELERDGAAGECEVAQRIASRLRLSQGVQNALLSCVERWDGKGMPRGLRGETIPLVSRIMAVAALVEILHRAGGSKAAGKLISERKGKSFDPLVVDAFLSLSQKPSFWAALEEEQSVWETVLSMEPDSRDRYIDGAQLDDAALAFADFVELKSPRLAGHARGVAALADRISAGMKLPETELPIIRRAAIMHDVGLVTVPAFTLQKPDRALSQAEHERLRLHPYHGERILGKVPAFQSSALSVGAHHERMDGQGYYRGLSGRNIPLGARMVAAADLFDDLTHDSPGRPALEASAALEAIRQEAGSNLDPEVVQALLEELGEAGQRLRPRREAWPAGLTDREVEVLRSAAQGSTRRQVAEALFLSENTIRHHLESIYSKIGVGSRAGAVLFAVEHDLLR